jgi:3-hydroxyacyl-CoA dehydrogenase
MTDRVKIKVQNYVAVVTIDNPPMNVLSLAVRRGISDAIQIIESEPGISAAVFWGAQNFSAGGDLRLMKRIAAGQIGRAGGPGPVFLGVEQCTKPIVMAIEGAALGGGLELAMAGHFRIASVSARFGQPEVKLGLIPGAGGTQRLPRLVGVDPALEMCITGRSIDAKEALDLGLIDELSYGDLLEDAVRLAAKARGSRLRKTQDRDDKLHKMKHGRILLERKAKALVRREELSDAELAIISALDAAIRLPFAVGYRIEQRLFRSCLFSVRSRSLVYMWLAKKEAARFGCQEHRRRLKIRSVGILGPPAFVKGVSQLFVTNQLPIAGRADVPSPTTGQLMQSIVPVNVVPLPFHPIRSRAETTQLDLLICSPRSVLSFENDVKFMCRGPKKFLAVAEAQGLKTLSERVCTAEGTIAMHVNVIDKKATLVELIRAKNTSNETLRACLKLMKDLGQTAIVVQKHCRSITYRLLTTYSREAQAIVGEGEDKAFVERVLTQFGMRSPFRPGGGASPRIEERVHAEECRSRANLIRSYDIINRCLFATVNKGCRLLEQGYVLRASDLDVAFTLSFGFAIELGGPMWYAEMFGIDRVYHSIKDLQRRHGRRWEPAPVLSYLSRTNKTFSQIDERISRDVPETGWSSLV